MTIKFFGREALNLDREEVSRAQTPSAENGFYTTVVYPGPLQMQCTKMAHTVKLWIWVALQNDI